LIEYRKRIVPGPFFVQISVDLNDKMLTKYFCSALR
jgi:hypothetical protein